MDRYWSIYSIKWFYIVQFVISFLLQFIFPIICDDDRIKLLRLQYWIHKTLKIGSKTFYFIQSKFYVYKWKLALALQSSIAEYEIFLLVKMTCGALYWKCLRWHIQRLKWNKNISGLCGKEIEINRDDAVIQSCDISLSA